MPVSKINKTSNNTTKQKRKFFRIQISSWVKFKILSEEQNSLSSSFTGKMLNISEGGILLVSKKYAPESSYVILVIKLRGFEDLEDILGKVKRVDKVKNGEYLLGIEFCKPQENFSFPSFQGQQIYPQFSNFTEKLRKVLVKHLPANVSKTV